MWTSQRCCCENDLLVAVTRISTTRVPQVSAVRIRMFSAGPLRSSRNPK